MFEKGSTLVLDDDKEYAVVDEYVDGESIYIYLVNMDDVSKVIIGKVEGEEISKLTDPNEIEKVLKEINKHLHPNN